MRALLLFLFCIIILISAAKSQDDYKPTPERRKIIQMIATLPEIAEEKSYLEKHSVKLVVYIDQVPTEKDNNYRVAVAQNNGSMLTGHQYFYVNNRTHAIRYFSVVQGKSIPLSIWRKHHYKD